MKKIIVILCSAWLMLLIFLAFCATAATLTATYIDLSTNESGFRLKRACLPATVETEVATAPVNVTTMTVIQVADLICTYRVFAFNEVGESGGSNAVTVSTRTIPNAPGSLTLVTSVAIREAQGAAVALTQRARTANNKAAIAAAAGTEANLKQSLTLAVKAEALLGE